ncbi:MAG: NAD(P) transhydrogenase subunit alpha, partial [Chlorobi bacterium]|nr:NAD(P) transhydrogenase subunit alpha [Chlorobiota bacterium]
MSRIGILKDSDGRVALVPQDVAALVKKGMEVLVEKGAGLASLFDDEEYEEAGARIVARDEVYSNSDIIVSVNFPSDLKLKEG